METQVNPIEQTYRRLKEEDREPLILFSGNPNSQGISFPGDPLIKSYREYFHNQDYQPHSKGLPEAREVISNYYREKDIYLDPKNILLTSGTSESFFYLFHRLCQPGDNILAPNPAYPLFDHIAEYARVQLRPYPLLEENKWGLDLDRLKESTDAKTKAILLVSPNNPTGAVTGPEEMGEIMAWCREQGLALICDEVFSEFYFGEGPFPRPRGLSGDGLIFTLNGISKMFALPALKLGWIGVRGDSKKVAGAVDHLETAADTFLTCHTPIQKALPAIFDEGQLFLKNYREEVLSRRNRALVLLREIPGLEYIEPMGGFYLLVRVTEPQGLSEEAWVIRLMEEKGVFVHPGYFFDYERGVHFVLSFLTRPEVLENGISKIAEFLKR